MGGRRDRGEKRRGEKDEQDRGRSKKYILTLLTKASSFSKINTQTLPPLPRPPLHLITLALRSEGAHV